MTASTPHPQLRFRWHPDGRVAVLLPGRKQWFAQDGELTVWCPDAYVNREGWSEAYLMTEEQVTELTRSVGQMFADEIGALARAAEAGESR